MVRKLHALALIGSLFPTVFADAQLLPFQHKVETFRSPDDGVTVFSLRLEQPFLAEEFEKSNYLRLETLDQEAFLIYPKQTRFHQKHAEFYGRLRTSAGTDAGTDPGTSEGGNNPPSRTARVRLSYEIVSEELDGSRRVDVRTTDIEIPIPKTDTGPESLYREWAKRQNEHFIGLLRHYPDESFFEYALLQSASRYGVEPPPFERPPPSRDEIENDLYRAFSGGLGVQQALQRRTLAKGPMTANLDVHISSVRSPSLRTLKFDEMLERAEEKGASPNPHPISKLIPADQYFVHLGSAQTLNELFSLVGDWGGSFLRLLTRQAREHHLRTKFEEQLCLNSTGVEELFSAGAISELAFTGADTFIAEGTDLTLLLRLTDRDAFDDAARTWLTQAKSRNPQLVEREFNYRGHLVRARYTEDRIVSSFVVDTDDYAIYSNSHRAIRRIIDTAVGETKSLHDATDYAYFTATLPPLESTPLESTPLASAPLTSAPSASPPTDRKKTAYLFASEAFLRRVTSPAWKISEKRRMQCFNNLVMLNNASLFYRMETGASPQSLSELVEGRYVDPHKLVCPHGGAYAFDAERDTCTCSLHNRLKYLTPNIELSVLQVSKEESQEYGRYRKRHEELWGRFFNPVGVRMEVGDRVRFEVAVLPFVNSDLYEELEEVLADTPVALDLSGIAQSAILSLSFAPGRESIREALRMIPGIQGLLEANPTLTDLSWIGDRVGLHLCDGQTILEIDPTRLREIDSFIPASIAQQGAVAAALASTNLPLYATVEVEDEDKATRLLRELPSRMFLERWDTMGLPSQLDAYRLPDYREHEIYVVSYQLYAMKLRLHVALVGQEIVAATRPRTLEQVIDAKLMDQGTSTREGQLLVRINRDAIDQMDGDLRVYWAEKARSACHRNIMSIYNLVKLYEIEISEIDRLSDAKYGVTYFCPDHGEYSFDIRRDTVHCSVHGNRRDARQHAQNDEVEGDGSPASSFDRFMDGLKELVTTLRFEEDRMIATIEVARQSDG